MTTVLAFPGYVVRVGSPITPSTSSILEDVAAPYLSGRSSYLDWLTAIQHLRKLRQAALRHSLRFV